MSTLFSFLDYSSHSVAIVPPPKPPVDLIKSAITFLGIRKRRISLLNNAPIEICREIVKMNFCRLKPANKEITDDEFLELISKVNTLTSVNLSGCWELTNKSVEVLAERFPSLFWIKCLGSFNNVEALSKHCLYLKHLELTGIFYQRQFGRSLQIIERFQELTALSLGNTIDYTMEELKKLIEKLPKLKKYSGRVNSEVLIAMANRCPNLTDLNICESPEDFIEDDAFETLALQCPNIRSISLDDCDEITHKTLSAFQKLKSLKLISCYAITGSEIIKFTEKYKQLKSLILDDLSEMSDENLNVIARNCFNLETISVNRCNSISDQGAIHLTEHCKELKSIRLWGDFNDEAVFAISKNLDDIRRLDLSMCNISDDSMVPFAQKHTKVTHIYLRNTSITDKTLFALAEYCHEVVKVYLQETHITEKGIVALIENCPHLRICFMGGVGKFQSPLRKKYPYIKFDNVSLV